MALWRYDAMAGTHESHLRKMQGLRQGQEDQDKDEGKFPLLANAWAVVWRDKTVSNFDPSASNDPYGRYA